MSGHTLIISASVGPSKSLVVLPDFGHAVSPGAAGR